MELTCIVCPNGCTLDVRRDGEKITVSGNRCPRGEKFAVSELTAPTRTLCTTVATVFPETPVLPVRTSREIPRERLFDVMKEINGVRVSSRVKRGDVIIPNVLELGADIIATGDII